MQPLEEPQGIEPRRWRLQDHARKLLPHHRVSHCMRTPYRRSENPVAIAQKVSTVTGEVRVGYSGLQTCASPWDCPVCGPKIAQVRREEMGELIQKATEQGLVVNMLTFTVRHSAMDQLPRIVEGLAQARRKFRNRKTWKRIAESWQVVGCVRAQEVTWGAENGWHVHFHELIITRGKVRGQVVKGAIESPEVDELRDAWAKACTDSNLQTPNRRGFEIRTKRKAEEYVSKWGLSSEIVQGDGKESTKNFTPWQLLQQAADGDVVAGAVFQTYADGMKGRRQIHWDKGLKKAFAINELSDEEIVNDEQTVETIAEIGALTWKVICKTQTRGRILRIFNEHERETALRFFGELVELFLSDGGSSPPQDVLNDLLHRYQVSVFR